MVSVVLPYGKRLTIELLKRTPNGWVLIDDANRTNGEPLKFRFTNLTEYNLKVVVAIDGVPLVLFRDAALQSSAGLLVPELSMVEVTHRFNEGSTADIIQLSPAINGNHRITITVHLESVQDQGDHILSLCMLHRPGKSGWGTSSNTPWSLKSLPFQASPYQRLAL